MSYPIPFTGMGNPDTPGVKCHHGLRGALLMTQGQLTQAPGNRVEGEKVEGTSERATRNLREGHERGAVGESSQRVLMGKLCPSNKAEDGTINDGGNESDLGRSLVERVKESNPFPSLDPYTAPCNPNSLYWSRT